MATILDILEKVELFDAEKEFMDSIDATANHAVDLNTEQLTHGFDSDGKRLTPSYGRGYWYAPFKNVMNPLPGMFNPDLKLTGDFHDGFFVSRKSLKNGYFEIDSFDWKTEHLAERYGEKIFGLNDENSRDFFVGYVMDYFAQRVLEELNLVMKNV